MLCFCFCAGFKPRVWMPVKARTPPLVVVVLAIAARIRKEARGDVLRGVTC